MGGTELNAEPASFAALDVDLDGTFGSHVILKRASKRARVLGLRPVAHVVSGTGGVPRSNLPA